MKPAETEQILTISQLNSEAKQLLEENFQYSWVIGEISNLSQPSSGHIYFTLKDNNAQVRCALFRMSRRWVNFTPENGQQVLVSAKVSLYEARGDFQLIASRMQLAGDGALQIAFEKLKIKLEQEGLFLEEHKKEIPKQPRCVGVITSSSGAALRDILHVLKRRFSKLPVIIYPSMVQGEQATATLIDAINTANNRNECDVLILARGGGSLEDLWCFNEEALARSIFESEIPVVTGIGHETDFTIADFVADIRCPTPSAAAEYISPDINEWRNYLNTISSSLIDSIKQQINISSLTLRHLQKRLRHPGDILREQSQHLDQLEQSLLLSFNNLIIKKKMKFESLCRMLDAVSPLQTLSRGYSILKDENNSIINSTKDVKTGQNIKAIVSDGQINLSVKSSNPTEIY